MDRKKRRIAENALIQLSIREGKTVEEIKKEIKKAMLIGLCSQDTKIQAHWNSIPCEGELPTPEELIVYMAEAARKNYD